MKKLSQYLISIFLMTFLINIASGFAGITTSSQDKNASQPDLNNFTQSDQDIQLLQHLIEVDAVQFESENNVYVRETLIFKNTGEKNFSGTLRTWIPDGLEGIRVERRNMMDGTLEYPLSIAQTGNIISWQDRIDSMSLPPLYAMEYLLKAEPQGTFTKSRYYSKKLVYPTLINYRYEGRPGLPVIVLKVIKPEGGSINLLDENRDKITTQEESEEGNSVVNRFYSPQFKELNIEISRFAVSPDQITVYAIIGLVIVLVISYPLLRTKSERLRSFEEKIRDRLKTEHGGEAEEATAEPAEPGEETEGDEELRGKTKEELENEKSELSSKLSKLEEDYTSGNIIDEEYEERRSSYREKIERITKNIERLE